MVIKTEKNKTKNCTICLVLTLDVRWEPQVQDHQESQKAQDHSHWLGEEGAKHQTGFLELSILAVYRSVSQKNIRPSR